MYRNMPNYKLIFKDILEKKFPDKKEGCESILSKESLSNIDIINLNKIIFGKSDSTSEGLNQKHRSYDEASILEILKFQKKNSLSNVQVGNHYKISRNTIGKWKKIFSDRDLK